MMRVVSSVNRRVMVLGVSCAFTGGAAIPSITLAGVAFYPGAGNVAPITSYAALTISGLNNSGGTIEQVSKSARFAPFTSYGTRTSYWAPGIAPRYLYPRTAGGGTTEEEPQTFGRALNNAGVVVGSIGLSQSLELIAAVWPNPAIESQSELTSAASDGLRENRAADINSAGVSVGSVFSATGDMPVRWSAGGVGTVMAIPATGHRPDGLVQTDATHINDNGVSIGFSVLYSGSTNLGFHAVRWNSAGTSVAVLGILSANGSGVSETSALALNDSGVAVGYASKYVEGASPQQRAVRWNMGGVAATELPALGVDVNGFGMSKALDINASGTVAGWTDKYDANGNSLGTRAVRWSAGNVITELGTLGTSPGTPGTAVANAINADGTVVGSSLPGNAGTVSHATVWLANSTVAIDLNTLLPAVAPTSPSYLLTEATHISDTGFVAGMARYFQFGGTASGTSYNAGFLMLVPQAGTYGKGDANFDTRTDFADLVILAQNYSQQNTTHAVNVADFDLNGVTDFNDLVVLAQNYGAGGPSFAGAAGGDATFTADWALAQSLIPEPALLAALAGCGAVSSRRRHFRAD